MELKQLKFFLAVAETLNFTRAAERMGIAQPPLSQRIRSLERELGAPLFIRTKRKVTLTQAGETLLLHARRLVNGSEHAKGIVRAVCDGRQGVLNVGAIFSAIYTLLPGALRTLKATAPDIAVNLREMTIANQVRALREGQIDLGILRPPIEDASVVTEVLYEEHFIAALPADHALVSRPSLSVQDFIDNPFIGISPEFSRNYSIVAASAFGAERNRVRVVHETLDMHTLVALVAAGNGLALVPQSLSFLRPPEIAFRPINFVAPSIAVSLAWHVDSTSILLSRFVDALRSSVKNSPLGRTSVDQSSAG